MEQNKTENIPLFGTAEDVQKGRERQQRAGTRNFFGRDMVQRQREQVVQHSREGRSGLLTFMTMARYAIDFAARTEPNPRLRQRKRWNMKRQWQQYRQSIMKIARR